jgi:hypothetical protein
MEPEASLPSLQVPATGPYSESDKPSPHPHALFLISIYYYPPVYSLGLRNGPFPFRFSY